MTMIDSQRFFQSWQSRECTTDGKLRPFSQTEVEHICLLNDHLKLLTVEVVKKAQRLSSLFLRELAQGNKDFEDYEVTASISMTYDDDNCGDELRMLIEHTWTQPAFEPISLSPGMSKQAQADMVVKTLELYNNEPSGIGRLWNELWDVHHVSLSWAFGHFFNNLTVFTMEDIMKIQSANFVTEVKISL